MVAVLSAAAGRSDPIALSSADDRPAASAIYRAGARCRLYERDGSPLAGALVCSWHEGGLSADVIVDHRPGAFVLCCLVGGRCDLLVALDRGPRLQARAEQIRFRPTVGRVCRLRFDTRPWYDLTT